MSTRSIRKIVILVEKWLSKCFNINNHISNIVGERVHFIGFNKFIYISIYI